MKNLLYLVLFLGLFTATAKAQQKDPKADSMLVEYYQTQKFAEAADYLKKTYPEPVSNLKIITQLAYISNMAGRLPDAEAYYQRLYETDSTNMATLFNMAGINFKRGHNAKAITYYKRILKIDSTNFSVYKQLALLSQSTSDIMASLAYMIKANTINPQDAGTAYDLSLLLISFHQNEQAEKVINIALQADTANLMLLRGKAQVVYLLKKYPETIQVCKKLMANDDKSSGIITYKGVSEFNLGKYSDCIKSFNLLDSNKMQNETSDYYLGMSYKALKKDAQAIVYLQKAIEDGISPNVDTYYSEIGDSYDRMHLAKKAVKAYQRGLTFGEKPMAYYALAAIYDTNLKDTANAIKYYKKYLAIKPEGGSQQSYVSYTQKRIKDLNR